MDNNSLLHTSVDVRDTNIERVVHRVLKKLVWNVLKLAIVFVAGASVGYNVSLWLNSVS